MLAGCLLPGHTQVVNTSMTPGNVQTRTAQGGPTTDVYKKETIPEKRPVPYPYVREADVMWAKDIWRVIDLRQRMNFPLRYPIEGKMSGGERYSLFGLLMQGIEDKEIDAYYYDPFIGWKDPFAQKATMEQIYQATGAGDSSEYILDPVTGELTPDPKEAYIYQFQLQEQWFFDKKHSTMNVRIVALAPVWYDVFNEDAGVPYPEPVKYIPFVVHFSQCRNLFAKNAVYNANNDAQAISFDDLFFQRRFASTIIAESNVYGNRELQSFKMGQDILLEADRIKNDLFEAEHDLWEY